MSEIGREEHKIKLTEIVFPNLPIKMTSENMNECIEDVKAFVRGEAPGCAVLGRVLPNMLKHYEIEPSNGAMILWRAGLDMDGVKEVLSMHGGKMGAVKPWKNTSGGLKRESPGTDYPIRSSEGSSGGPAQTAPASRSSKKRARKHG